MKADVLVIGGGIVGCSTALACRASAAAPLSCWSATRPASARAASISAACASMAARSREIPLSFRSRAIWADLAEPDRHRWRVHRHRPSAPRTPGIRHQPAATAPAGRSRSRACSSNSSAAPISAAAFPGSAPISSPPPIARATARPIRACVAPAFAAGGAQGRRHRIEGASGVRGQRCRRQRASRSRIQGRSPLRGTAPGERRRRLGGTTVAGWFGDTGDTGARWCRR